MRELIDRDAAIEAVEALCRKHQDILNKQLARRQSHESHALYSEGLRDGCEVVIAALRSLPAAEKGEGRPNEIHESGDWRPLLRPCPFCGHKVEMDDDPDAWERGCGYAINCEKCNVSMWSFRENEKQCERPSALAARWNVDM